MKKEIRIDNRTIDGKYQPLIFATLDILDFIGKPICFVLGDGLVIKNFNFDVRGWNRNSTKYLFAKIVRESQTGNTIIPNNL